MLYYTVEMNMSRMISTFLVSIHDGRGQTTRLLIVDLLSDWD